MSGFWADKFFSPGFWAQKFWYAVRGATTWDGEKAYFAASITTRISASASTSRSFAAFGQRGASIQVAGQRSASAGFVSAPTRRVTFQAKLF
jgi:hypothetical protein